MVEFGDTLLGLVESRPTKLSFGIFEFTETATNTMITLPKGMENGKMEKRAHIVFLHQRHHMKLKNDVRPRIGRFFILVVSASSNKSIVRPDVYISHISDSVRTLNHFDLSNMF